MHHLSTHVLDTSLGRPAAGIAVVAERREPDGQWTEVGRGETDADGRVGKLAPVAAGDYRLTFAVAAYFHSHGVAAFFPEVVIRVRLDDARYHVPLLLSPFGYSTYRGS